MRPARRSAMRKTLTPSLPVDTRSPRPNVEKASCLIKVYAPPDQTWRQGPWGVNVLDLENGVWRWLCSWRPWQQVGSWESWRDSSGTSSVATSSALTYCHGKDSGACLLVYSDSYFESQAELNPENLGLSSSSFDCFRVILKSIASNCNTLQHAAKHCNTLQQTATHCNTLQHTATHCNTIIVKKGKKEKRLGPGLGCGAFHSWKISTPPHRPQHFATPCNTLRSTATQCNTLHHTAKHGNAPQYGGKKLWGGYD